MVLTFRFFTKSEALDFALTVKGIAGNSHAMGYVVLACVSTENSVEELRIIAKEFNGTLESITD